MTLGLGDVDYGYICAGCHDFVQYNQCHDCEGFDEGSVYALPPGFALVEPQNEISEKLDKIIELLEE